MIRRACSVILAYVMIAVSFCFVVYGAPAYNLSKEQIKESSLVNKEGEKIVKRDVAAINKEKKLIIIRDTLLASNPRLPTSVAGDYAKHVVSAADFFKIDPFLIAAVMIKESTANYMSASSSSCGLMQIHWDVHKNWLMARFGFKDKREIYDPKINIYAGSMLLSGYLKKEGSVEGALARYLGARSQKYAGFVITRQMRMQQKYKEVAER